jgi:hypothetical protein
MGKNKRSKAQRVYRDATTGRFVTKKYAKKHPKRTIKEPRASSEWRYYTGQTSASV